MARKKLQLYVWTDFAPGYTSGLAFAIASNEQDARELITKDVGFEAEEWGELKIYPLNAPIAKAIYGAD